MDVISVKSAKTKLTMQVLALGDHSFRIHIKFDKGCSYIGVIPNPIIGFQNNGIRKIGRSRFDRRALLLILRPVYPPVCHISFCQNTLPSALSPAWYATLSQGLEPPLAYQPRAASLEAESLHSSTILHCLMY